MAKLTYFNGRGRAEMIRLLLASAGIQFTEIFLEEKSEIEKLREDGSLAFGQVPLLEIDGLQIVQCGAIVRYIARKAGMYGSNDAESALIDMYFEGSRDFQQGFYPILFISTLEELIAEVKNKGLTRYLPAFEKRLSANGTGFLVGKTISLADVGLLETLLNIVEYTGINTLSDFPHIKTFFDSVTKSDRIAAFLTGPQRKGPNDEKYIAVVKRVLPIYS